MKLSNFYKIGTFLVTGDLRIGDACELNKPQKLPLLSLKKGEYEVRLLTGNYEIESEESTLPNTAVMGVMLKKKGAKINLNELKEKTLEKAFLTTKNLVFIRDNFKPNEEQQEEILWSALAKPKNDMLYGKEQREYGWWEMTAVTPEYLCIQASPESGLKGKNDFKVLESKDAVVILFQEGFENIKSFHKNKKELFKTRAELIRENFLTKVALMIKVKECTRKKEAATKDALKFYGLENPPKELMDTLNTILERL